MTPKRNPCPRHISVRLRPELVARIDALAPFLRRLGAESSRSAVVRAALLVGLPTIEARHNEPRAEPREEIDDRDSTEE
jgi:Arc/MetJ-type ribon-helix-helix transcriptional regulator